MKYLFGVIFCSLAANFIFAAEKIDINAAPLEDLIKIIHIGEVRALELISLRPFSSLDDLIRIKGIGEKRVEDIKNQGLAWIGEPGLELTETAETGFPLTQEISEENFPTTTPPVIAEDSGDSGSDPGLTLIEAASTPTQPQPITYPTGIVINEILPSPIGPDEEEEWIEIFNKNNFGVNLSGWKITDKEGGVKIYAFPEKSAIRPNGFLVLSRPTTKITLNNQGDGLKLIQPNENVTDEMSHGKVPRGESYSRFESGWTWTPIVTPGTANVLPTPAPALEEKTAENNSLQLAAVGEQVPKNSNTSFLFIAAIFTSLFSGVIILVLKHAPLETGHGAENNRKDESCQ